jgi:hypothetical protein
MSMNDSSVAGSNQVLHELNTFGIILCLLSSKEQLSALHSLDLHDRNIVPNIHNISEVSSSAILCLYSVSINQSSSRVLNVTGPSQEELWKIRDAISKASSLEEVERLNRLLQSGQIPGRSRISSKGEY